MIDLNKRYETLDGRAVELVCIDGSDASYPIHGIVEGVAMQWTPEGYAVERRLVPYPQTDDIIEILEQD